MVTQKRYYKFKLREPNKGKEKLMEEAIGKFKSSVNYWLELIDEMGEYPRRGNTHRFGYDKVRDKFPKLYSETVQEAMNRAIQIYRANGTSEYKEDSMSFRSRFVEIESHFIKLPLLKNEKPWLPFFIPPKFKKLFDYDYGNVVLKKGGNWFVYIAFKVPCEEKYEPNGWFGVDLGLNNILVLSDVDGKVNKFYNGKKLKKIRGEYLEKRRHLQEQKSRKNNKLRALKHISGKESNYTDYVNHKISRDVVKLAKKYQYGIAYEDLKGIRNKSDRDLSSWKFRDLLDKIEYKAEEEGVPLQKVNPKYTSRTCSKCGYKDKNNRKNGEFICQECGFELNADLNASRNIASIPPTSKEVGFLEPK